MLMMLLKFLLSVVLGIAGMVFCLWLGGILGVMLGILMPFVMVIFFLAIK